MINTPVIGMNSLSSVPAQLDQAITLPLRINLISDTHHLTDLTLAPWMPDKTYRSEERLEWLFAMAAQQAADITLVTGDLVDRRHEPSHRDFDRRLESSNLSGAFFVTPGNHDHRGALKDDVRSDAPTAICTDGAKTHYLIRRGNHFLFVLDNAPWPEFGEPNAGVYGELSEGGREWLKGQLESLPEDATAWIFGHYPTHRFVDWIADRSILKDGAELHALLASHREKVGAVFSGHLHKRFDCERDGVRYHSLTPASVALTLTHTASSPEIITDPHGSPGFESLILSGRREYSLRTIEATS
jgi:3',5'-cyclic AMP phosphodiesterase CpdA